LEFFFSPQPHFSLPLLSLAANRPQVRKVELGEQDDLWVRFRHLHIADVFRQVTESFKEFTESAKQTQGLKFAVRHVVLLTHALIPPLPPLPRLEVTQQKLW